MSLYKQKASQVWWSNLRHNGARVRQSTGETDRAAAQKRENQFQVALWALPSNDKGKTWGEAVIAWTSVEARSDSELLSLAKFGRNYSDRPLVEVTRENVNDALAFCRSAGTYMRYRTMIAAILNLAKRAGWIANPPLLAVRRDKKTKRRNWLTHDQWLVLLAELPKHLKPMATFAIETGLRQENVLGLRWAEVSIERRMAWVEAEDAKADAALAVPLNDAALAVLVSQKALLDAQETGEKAFVFTFRGRRVADVKTAFMAACVRAKLGEYVLDENNRSHYQGFTWHGLRHTWATWHAQNNTPMEVLQKLGGWKDMRMVLVYAHHSAGFVAKYANNTKREDDPR